MFSWSPGFAAHLIQIDISVLRTALSAYFKSLIRYSGDRVTTYHIYPDDNTVQTLTEMRSDYSRRQERLNNKLIGDIGSVV